MALLIHKGQLQELLRFNKYSETTDISKIGCSKGFQTIKILYEKTLTLNHHYAQVITFNEVNNSSADKKSLKEVECILDFTLGMHNDLNTMYFETAFLQKRNTDVMLELQQLFVDHTKPIKYHTALEQLRNTDDWESVRDNLCEYLKELDNAYKR
ncbi:hypothetical protein CW736_04720 [Nonlabens sp. MB-3u-79]|uniref:hypothetical protein n=1 Tax=Nonlabens sp. MB-3u-79 TaxID=2058134 RepID=UPI000C317785|nr:hypothetical protein [Nonlabens sp. MB-3u-79]AUC78739.1 hypothetical protein CW736_04720 [Nonlabens sp. MB-3u-79]